MAEYGDRNITISKKELEAFQKSGYLEKTMLSDGKKLRLLLEKTREERLKAADDLFEIFGHIWCNHTKCSKCVILNSIKVSSTCPIINFKMKQEELDEKNNL